MSDADLSTTRGAASVLDPPPYVVSLYDRKGMEPDPLADALAVGVLQAPCTRVNG
jgi:hypothetical protein